MELTVAGCCISINSSVNLIAHQDNKINDYKASHGAVQKEELC